MDAPELTGGDGTVRLRPYRPDDVPHVVEQCRDATTTRWVGGLPRPYGTDDATRYVERAAAGWAEGSWLALAVEHDGRFAGGTTLRPDGRGGAEVGYGLTPASRGRGVAAAAVRLLLAWAFDALPVEVVHWRAAVGNWPSRRVAWACGFTVEGRVRGLLPHPDGRQDAWVGSLRRGEPTRPTSAWLDVPELVVGDLRLRRNRPEDVERVAEACADPTTQAWLPQLPSPYTVEDARWYLESRPEQNASGDGIYWGVADVDDDVLLAQVGLMGLRAERGAGEVGYWTHPDARGRRVMQRAVRAVSRHALLAPEEGGLGLTRVMLRVADGNEASARVALAAGFTEVGRDRRAERLRDGSVRDFRRFDLLVEEMEQAWVHPAALR
ncbi:GNAT family N-acetyltransferase [Thalassiella azotivora]